MTILRIGIANNVQTIQLKECFDERVPSEKQAYVNLLRREAKGITDLTLRLGYQHGIANNVQTIQLKECFDERVPSEKQAYVNLLRREAKGITDLTLRLGYQHG
ncbi:hypothetical protein Glove_368g9 [Diversispora epigaea]|uniref:Uncharacterized protein n=1 Tax=Diversispora epigaea TaxID=1348612 RepID=A0A397H6T2_9GLOM|nr:hypothetical protein Glove_368g9 [Diversispora epigaea]